MPERIIRPGILTSDRVCALTWAGEVFYRRLMSVVDDFGRYDARPAILRAALYPLQLDRVSNADIGKWRQETVKAGLVSVYAVELKEYLELHDFRQRLRATVSKYPAPQFLEECRTSAGIRTRPHDNAIGDGDGDGDGVRAADKPLAQFRSVDSLIPDSLSGIGGFAEAWKAFKDHRKKLRKPMTAHAETLILRRLGERPIVAIQTVETMIEKGWQSFEWEWIDRNTPGNHNSSKPPVRAQV